MKTNSVIIVGARVAGASLAIRLAKMGVKVTLVDKADLPSDTLSTHFMNPRGMTYLQDLEVLNRLDPALPRSSHLAVEINGIDLGGSVPVEAIAKRMREVHDRDFDVQTDFACIRRRHLDQVLLQYAQELGVEVLAGYALVGLDADSNTVQVKSFEGQERSLTSDLIVGADGRASRVAQLLNLGYREYREVNTFAVYTYVKGLKIQHRLAKKNRLGMGVAATNDSDTMVLLYGPSGFFESFKTDRDENFYKGLRSIDPQFEAELRAAIPGQKIHFRSAVKLSSFIRQENKRIPLIGDAASFKDQVTASGMMHALRDATLLADYIQKHLQGSITLSEALDCFESARYRDSLRFFDFTCQQAEMNPPKNEELDLYQRMSLDPTMRSKFVSLYTDTIDPREFAKAVDSMPLQQGRQPYQEFRLDRYENIFSSQQDDLASFTRSVADFSQPAETSFVERSRHYAQCVRQRIKTNTFQYERTLLARPANEASLYDQLGRIIKGLNFASQDYLALAQSEAIREAALRALRDFGPHSAGSPMVVGNTKLSRELEDEIRSLTGKKHVLLYPTGYAAGMGAILGMIRSRDHIVMDRLTHACLQQGAFAATRNVHRFSHLDAEAARYVLQGIRKKDARSGVLLITEGIFSMDADSPDLPRFQALAHEYEATLLVDVAHDLGALGPKGQGVLGAQNFYGQADLVMGSFSKTFATNGGFVASDSEDLALYLKMYSTPFMFSNALSPLSCAVALQAARIVQGPEGERRRQQLMNVVETLRSELTSRQLKVLGQSCAIVPVLIGSEKQARLAHRYTSEFNMAAMILEYPVVPLGATRYQLQVMASHTQKDARDAAAILADVNRRLRGISSPLPIGGDAQEAI